MDLEVYLDDNIVQWECCRHGGELGCIESGFIVYRIFHYGNKNAKRWFDANVSIRERRRSHSMALRAA